jgi:hypothetical protein
MHVVRLSLAVALCTSSVLAFENLQSAPSSASKRWMGPVTSYGDPDLQGVWMNNRATPLERPKGLEGRHILTDAEVAVLQQRADRLFKSGDSDYAAGDAVFLAAFADLAEYKNAAATASSFLTLNTVFDNRTSLIVDPPDGRIPSTTAAAQERRRAVATARAAAFEQGRAQPKDLSNPLRCITWGTPRLLISPYTSHYQIIQAPGYVVLYLEADVRIIPVDGRPHLTSSVQALLGDSRGRWEGNTLVVDTTNFSPKSDFMGSSDHLHLVERFTRVSRDTINYDITIDDPTTWTRPWTVEIRLARTDDMLYEDACHEGNYEVMRGMLAAPRAEEKAEGKIRVQ